MCVAMPCTVTVRSVFSIEVTTLAASSDMLILLSLVTGGLFRAFFLTPHCTCSIMNIKKLLGRSHPIHEAALGADLSRPPPIYRPAAVPPTNKLKFIIGTLQQFA